MTSGVGRAGGGGGVDWPELGEIEPALIGAAADAAEAAPVTGSALPRSLDSVLAAAPAELGAMELGRAAAALARVVRRGAQPGESEKGKRLRELCAKYLELMHEAAAGVGRISIG